MIPWLAFFGALELGVLPLNGFDALSTRPDTPVFFYTTFSGDVRIADNYYVGGSAMTSIVKLPSGLSFDPRYMMYDFHAVAVFADLEIGFRHVCGPHSVMAYFDATKPASSNTLREGAYEQIYIRFSTRTK